MQKLLSTLKLAVITALVSVPIALAASSPNAQAATTTAPPNDTVAPSITLSNGVVTGAPGTWTGTPAPTLTFQWVRCTTVCSAIPGATAITYTTQAADNDATLYFDVFGKNSTGSTTTTSKGLIINPPPPPAPPTLTGALTITSSNSGALLTANLSTWTGTQPIAYTYQWERCLAGATGCTNIPGQTGTTYATTAADTGNAVVFSVTAKGPGGTVTAVSTPAPYPVKNTALPSIVSSPQELVAKPGTFTGTNPMTTTWQWFRCHAGDCEPITGATANFYVVQPNLDQGPGGDVTYYTFEAQETVSNIVNSVTVTTNAVPYPPPVPGIPPLMFSVAPYPRTSTGYFTVDGAPGQTVTEQAVVTNGGSQAGVGYFWATDGGTSTSTGSAYYNPTDNPAQWSPWISFSDPFGPLNTGGQYITLGPGQSQVFTVTITIPPNAAPGYRLMGIGAQVAPNPAPPVCAPVPSGEIGLCIKVITDVIIGVEVNVGGPYTTQLTISSVDLASIAGYQCYDVNMDDTGDTLFQGTLNFNVENSSNQVVFSAQRTLGTMVPYANSIPYDICNLGTPLPGGNYHIVITGEYGNMPVNDVVEQPTPLNVTLPLFIFTPIPPDLVTTPSVAANEPTVTLSGSTVTATTGNWVGAPAPVFNYTWERCTRVSCSVINAIPTPSPTYTLTSADVGDTICVTVNAINTTGSARAVSVIATRVITSSDVAASTSVAPTTLTAKPAATSTPTITVPLGKPAPAPATTPAATQAAVAQETTPAQTTPTSANSKSAPVIVAPSLPGSTIGAKRAVVKLKPHHKAPKKHRKPKHQKHAK